MYDGVNWNNSELPPSVTDLTSLTDTNIVTPINQDGIVYDGVKWSNKQILDSEVQAPVDGQVLQYNEISSKWENKDVAVGDGTQLSYLYAQ